MVLNLRLAPAGPVDPSIDTMGRSWNGFNPECSDAELWAQNRGRYAFKTESVEAERFATMSYQGVILVVAALRPPKWEPFEDCERGIVKKALIGDVLGPGDPAYDALHGQDVPRDRSSWAYLADDEYGVAGIEATAIPDGVAHEARAPAQGWQSDSVRRKQVEDAAQDRLMEHYRADGWTVTDTRFGRPYDAVARRGEGEALFLEAKGTETHGAAVLVSKGEVKHARENPGQCVMGVLTSIRFSTDGTVDPESGTFRILPFAPAVDALVATGYEWRLPAE